MNPRIRDCPSPLRCIHSIPCAPELRAPLHIQSMAHCLEARLGAGSSCMASIDVYSVPLVVIVLRAPYGVRTVHSFGYQCASKNPVDSPRVIQHARSCSQPMLNLSWHARMDEYTFDSTDDSIPCDFGFIVTGYCYSSYYTTKKVWNTYAEK